MENKVVSFGIGGLLIHETLALIDYLIEGKIKELSEVIKTTDVLKTNSESSRIRLLTELRRRNKAVSIQVWQFIKNANPAEQRLALFYVCLKASKLLFDFQFEVVLQKWRAMDYSVSKDDVLFFLDKKSLDYPDIEKWSETTKVKSATVVIRMLNESGLLKNNKLTQPEEADSFWRFFVDLGDPWFLELCLLNKEQRDRIIEG